MLAEKKTVVQLLSKQVFQITNQYRTYFGYKDVNNCTQPLDFWYTKGGWNGKQPFTWHIHSIGTKKTSKSRLQEMLHFWGFIIFICWTLIILKTACVSFPSSVAVLCQLYKYRQIMYSSWTFITNNAISFCPGSRVNKLNKRWWVRN